MEDVRNRPSVPGGPPPSGLVNSLPSMTSETEGSVHRSKPNAVAATRLMLVDDDDDSRELVSQLLVRAGFEVSDYSSAEEALDSLGDAIPDAVVTDVNLPGVDGYALAARLHDDPRTASVPIVAVTGVAALKKIDGASPFESVLVKPISLQALISVIRRLVSGEVGVAALHA